MPRAQTPGDLAAEIAAGRTVVWCDWPVLDGTATAGDHLHVLGWAYCAAGLEEIAVFAQGRRFEPRTGAPRPDVNQHLPGFTGSASGFALVLDTTGWPQGPHEVTIRARGRGGHAAARTGTVHIGPDLPYRAWLRRAGADETSAVGRSESLTGAGFPLTVHVLEVTGASSALEASLAKQTHTSWSKADGTLAETLKVAARGEAATILVEDGGALAPQALERLAAAMRKEPTPDLVYSDEDAMMPDGERGAAFLKPGWSPELLLSTDYVGPLVAIGPRAASAAIAAEARPPETIYELLLRIVDVPLSVQRLPAVLFTSRAPRIPAAGPHTLEAIDQLAARRGRRVHVAPLEHPGLRDVRWELDQEPLVSVVIPTSLSHRLVAQCLRSLRERTTYPRLEVVIVDSSADGLASMDELLEGLTHQIVPYQGKFNFSAAVNMGARAASGEYLLLLNDDTEVRSADWVERMLEHALTPGVGVVGCKLLYADGKVQHAGVVLDLAGAGAWHVHWGFAAAAAGYRGMLQMTRNCSAVTGACMLVATELFVELGGFDESYNAEFSDIDLCLRAIERGLRVVCTPRAMVTHHERSSLPLQANRFDFERFLKRWSARYSHGDPFYHPAFLPMSYEFSPSSGEAATGDGPVPVPATDSGNRDPSSTTAVLEALESPPTTFEGLVEAVSAGRTAMWCEAPLFDGSARAVGYLDVQGWAYSRAGIDAVFVYLDGLGYRARHDILRLDIGSQFSDDDLSRSGFALAIELGEDQVGGVDVAVVAHGGDGHAVGMRGVVECRPGSGVLAASASASDADAAAARRASERTLELLQLAEQGRREAEQKLEELTRSLSWRITRPLRWSRRVLGRGE